MRFLAPVIAFCWIIGGMAAVLLGAPQRGGKVNDVIEIPGNVLLDPGSEKVVKSDAEWKHLLTPEQYQITRKGGTERAFSGAYEHNKQPGWYVCVACGNPLFSSETKFDSGTGWPSFFEAVARENVIEESDRTYGMVRTEVHCSRCGSHLGHVFEDGPPPTHLRYCINGVAMNFKPE